MVAVVVVDVRGRKRKTARWKYEEWHFIASLNIMLGKGKKEEKRKKKGFCVGRGVIMFRAKCKYLQTLSEVESLNETHPCNPVNTPQRALPAPPYFKLCIMPKYQQEI